MNDDSKVSKILPVMLAFFTMGFSDLVGIATNYVKKDFVLSDTAANSFSVMMFLWFFVLSIPTSILMNRIGRKKTVLLSMLITLLGLSIPIINYSDISMFVVFSFLGIGNTLMQVSLNPLIANMIEKKKLSSYLTLGQFVKAIASFMAPIIASQAALYYGNWKLLFYIFAGINIVAFFYLLITDIKEAPAKNQSSSFIDCIKLLGDVVIVFLFLGILVHVGIDVGINITAPKLLQERAGIPLELAGYITSIYFLFRTVGCLSGTFILAKFSPIKFFMLSVCMIFVGILGLYFCNGAMTLYICIALIGFGNSNIFPIIFSNALLYMPIRNNEISGLMIMGIGGGAIFPVLMGIASDTLGGQVGAVIVLTICVCYLLFLMFKLKKLALV
jgi:fucose permease